MPRPISQNYTPLPTPSSMPSSRPKAGASASIPWKLANGDAVLQMRLTLQQLQQQQEESLVSLAAMLELLDTSMDADATIEQSCEQKVAAATFAANSSQAEIVKTSEKETHGCASDKAPVKRKTKKSIRADKLIQEVAGEGQTRLAMLINDNAKADNENEGGGWFGRLRSGCKRILSRPMFDYVMGLVILANSVCVGIETQYSIEMPEIEMQEVWPGQTLDVIFVSIYMVELAMRLLAFGVKMFRDSWFIFDCVLVGLGCVSNILLPIVVLISATPADTGPLSQVLVVRSLRLLRLIRALRMLKIFRTVWRLVFGLLTSGNAMMSTFFLLLLMLYIFACGAIELITKDQHLATHPDTAWIVSYHFGSLHRTLLTLLAFVCADSVAGVYAPLIIEKPFLFCYFLALLLVISVALMNLVTAVLVEGALNNASADKELAKHDLKQTVKTAVPQLMQIFKDHDINGDGTLTLEEIRKLPINVMPADLFDDSVQNMADIFEMLDVEGDGELTQVEFAEGILNLFLMDVPIQTVQTLKLLRINDARMKDLHEQVDMVAQKLRVTPAYQQVARP